MYMTIVPPQLGSFVAECGWCPHLEVVRGYQDGAQVVIGVDEWSEIRKHVLRAHGGSARMVMVPQLRPFE